MKKKAAKIILTILAAVLIFGTVKLTVPYVRNMGIDRIRATVEKAEDCYYSDSDIDSAIKTVKDMYKEKEWPVSLVSVRFSDEKSREKLKGYHLSEKAEKENIIVIFCDYIVLKDFAAYSWGLHTEWSAILLREDENSPWVFVDGGYA